MRTTMRDFNPYELKLEETVTGKGAPTAIEMLREINKSGVKLGVIGGVATGKTVMLKSIISGCGKGLHEVADEIMDDAKLKEDYEFICTDNCRYFTAHAVDTASLLDRVKVNSDGKDLGECCIIEMKNMADGKRCINRITEVEYKGNGEPVITTLLDVHKEKYRKVAEPSLTK